jgi:4-oxalocrotonate tautomerase
LHGSAGPKGRQNMPEVVVYALGGRSLDQKRGLMKDITDAVVKNYKVEPAAVVITLVESEKQDKMKGGVLFSEAGQHK